MTKLLYSFIQMDPKELDVDIVPFIQEKLTELPTFTIYQTSSNSKIAKWTDNRIGPLLGFNKFSLIPYISDPTGKVAGSFTICDEKLIYQPKSPRLDEMRDSFTWEWTHHEYFIQLGVLNLVNEFMESGFQLHQYQPLFEHNPTFIYSPDEIHCYEDTIPISLDKILKTP